MDELSNYSHEEIIDRADAGDRDGGASGIRVELC